MEAKVGATLPSVMPERWPAPILAAETWPACAEWIPTAPDRAFSGNCWRKITCWKHGQIVENKWALILHGIALMTPTNTGEGATRTAHDGAIPVGRALYAGGYSEMRFNRLLTSREDMLRTLLARMFRMMAAKDIFFNWREMAQFILNDGYDEEAAEQSRRRIARDYYRAQRQTAASD